MGAKQLAYSDEARQKLLVGRQQAGPGGPLHPGAARPQRRARQGLGQPHRHQGRRHRRRGNRAARSLREHGRPARQGSGQQDQRRGRRRHHHRDRPGRGHLPRRAQDHRRRRRPDGPDPRHPEGRRRVVEELHQLAEKIDAKDEKEITEVATIAANNNPEIGKKLAEAMKLVGATNGVITIEEGKTAETEVVVVQGMQFDRGYLSPHFVTNQDTVTVELENPYILIYEEKISSRQEPDPAARDHLQEERAAADHRRGRRRRRAGDAGAEQAQGHPPGLRRQGARLRRPPQGHAGGHRHADRRQGHLQGPGHPAREHPAPRPGPGQEGQDRRREHDHHRRRRRQEGHRGPGRDDPPRDRARPTASTTARSCRSGWPSWPAAWPRSRSGPPPRPR